MQRMTKLQAWLLAFEFCSNRSNLIEPGVAVCLSYGGLLYSTAVSSGNCKNSLFCDDDNFKLISLQLLIVLTFVPVTSFNHGGCLGDGPPEILLKF